MFNDNYIKKTKINMINPIIKSETYVFTHDYYLIEYIDGTKIELPSCGLDMLRGSRNQRDIDFLDMIDRKEKELYRKIKLQKIITQL